MSFENGTFSVAMFALPQALPDDCIDLLNANRAGSMDLVKDEPEIGRTSIDLWKVSNSSGVNT